jgi:hypothetical protein
MIGRLSGLRELFRVFIFLLCRDNIKAPESFMGTSDAVNAINSLEREIAAIDERFARGELNSFGQSEEVVLQRFQELRRKQVDLSRRQVELLSKKAKGRFGTEQGGLEQLSADMQKICAMIEQVEVLTQPERGPAKDKSEEEESKTKKEDGANESDDEPLSPKTEGVEDSADSD